MTMNLSKTTVLCFVVLVLNSMEINGQTTLLSPKTTAVKNGSHICEALEANNNRIEYTLNAPQETEFHNYISLRGLVWRIDFNFTDDSPEEKSVYFQFARGRDLSETFIPFFGQEYRLGFSIRDSEEYMGIPMDYRDVIIGGLKNDFRSILWMRLTTDPRKHAKRTKRNKGKKRIKRQMQEFQTGFNEVDFQPHTAFNTMANLNDHYIFFLNQTKSEISTRVVDPSASYRSRFQVFYFPKPKSQKWWTNVTDTAFDKVPTAARNLSSKYLIKAVLPVALNPTTNGSIILIEICSTNDIPCTGSISTQFCVVANDETSPTDEGKPCQRNQLKPLYDCSNWKSGEGRLDEEISTFPDESTNGTEPTTIIISEETELATTPETRPTTPEPTEEPKSGMWWLWIIIIALILIAILILLLCLCCRKGKTDEKKLKDAPVGQDQGVSSPMSSLSTASTRSGVDNSASKASKIGGEPSSLSTVSARSGGKSAIGSKSSNIAQSTLSTASNRSGVNAGQSSVGSKSSNVGQSTLSTASNRSGV